MSNLDFSELSRWPDVEDENLYAFDASDELLLNEAASAFDGLPEAGSLAVVGDRYGALTLGAAVRYRATGIRVYQDPLAGELALHNNAQSLGLEGSFSAVPLEAASFAGAKVVLWQLPKSLEELRETAQLIAANADPNVQVFAAGRVKHMSRSMNHILEQSFSSVQAGLAWRKSRPLRASGPQQSAVVQAFPKKEYNPDVDLWLCAHGATFGGTKLDHGTRFLLEFSGQMKPSALTAVDLGCGNGTIAAYLAKERPELAVIASDQSAAAVASARATARENGLTDRVTTLRDDALSTLEPASAQLVVLNPPFHIGSAVHAGIALKLFDAAARVLAPGGELWTVYNRHLDYEDQLAKKVGNTRVIGRNAKFCVAVSVKGP